MASQKAWTVDHIPDQQGRIAVVTGANSGIGFVAARELARKGAQVVLACRNDVKAKEAMSQIQADVVDAKLDFIPLDLASLESIGSFAEQVKANYDRLDLLCNNAGIMAIPKQHTRDGFEMQIGTNHFGHFALTGQLLDRLIATPNSRVVNVSSNAHLFGKMNFNDLHWETGYGKWKAYAQSKLANLLFTYELDRKLRAKQSPVKATACHPGWSSTNLQYVGPQQEGSAVMQRMAALGNRLAAQPAEMGALPTLYAATEPSVEGGDYIGPNGWFENAGYPKKTSSNRRSRSEEDAARLWQISEEQSQVGYSALQ